MIKIIIEIQQNNNREFDLWINNHYQGNFQTPEKVIKAVIEDPQKYINLIKKESFNLKLN